MEVPAINGWQNSPVECNNEDDAGEVAEDEERIANDIETEVALDMQDLEEDLRSDDKAGNVSEDIMGDALEDVTEYRVGESMVAAVDLSRLSQWRMLLLCRRR